MTTTVRQIKPEQVERGMIVEHVETHPTFTITTRGPVHSVGNRTSLLIGNADDYTEAPFRTVGKVVITISEVVELPSKYRSVILVQKGGDCEPLMMTENQRWIDTVGAYIANQDVVANFVRVLWEPET